VVEEKELFIDPNLKLADVAEELNIPLHQLSQFLNDNLGKSFSIYKNRADGDPWTNGYTKEELIKDTNEIELECEPGSEFQYSNSGYAVVGYICENVSGLSYKQLLKKYVTDKYDLPNTAVNLNDQQKKLLITPYRKDDRDIATKSSIFGMDTPGSGVSSNATDLIKLVAAQMESYRLYEAEGAKSPLILTREMAKMDDDLQYGFGLGKQTKGKNIKYGHGGDADGFACEYFFNPEENTGVVILTSSGGQWISELAFDILENL
jgi:CubicO group peptidase (beta-lactamase class C family)